MSPRVFTRILNVNFSIMKSLNTNTSKLSRHFEKCKFIITVSTHILGLFYKTHLFYSGNLSFPIKAIKYL